MITDTILSELFSLTNTPSAREWKILTKTYSAQFKSAFPREFWKWALSTKCYFLVKKVGRYPEREL